MAESPFPEIGAVHRNRLRIHVLGRFQILRDGRLLAFGRKRPRRPLDLLKRLAASGDLGAGASSLADKIWPDLDGDAARGAFDITLHRLRELLGVPDVLVLFGGRLWLDPGKCWIDISEFAAIVKKVEKMAFAESKFDIDQAQVLASELLHAYTGHFLENENQEAWVMACRDQLQEKFGRTVLGLAIFFEHHNRWDLAAVLYSRALELDNLAEPLYRRLMLCYRELGETAEALRVFRRCRELLSVVLSTSPSSETRAVHATLACRYAGRTE